MKNFIVIIILALSVCSCQKYEERLRQESITKEENSQVNDQCIRREIFLQCISITDPHPNLNNDNRAKIISECGTQSYYLSLRQKSRVKPECLSGER